MGFLILSHKLSVRCELQVFNPHVCELLHVTPISVHHVKVNRAGSSVTIKRNLTSVGRSVGKVIICRVAGQVAWIASIGIHHIDFPVPVAFAVKHNLLTVGRPGRKGITLLVECQLCLVAPIGVHRMDFGGSFMLGIKDNFALKGAATGKPRAASFKTGTHRGINWIYP